MIYKGYPMKIDHAEIITYLHSYFVPTALRNPLKLQKLDSYAKFFLEEVYYINSDNNAILGRYIAPKIYTELETVDKPTKRHFTPGDNVIIQHARIIGAKREK
jgi:hypothetical protein